MGVSCGVARRSRHATLALRGVATWLLRHRHHDRGDFMQEFESQAEAFRALIEQELQDGKLNFPTSLDASIRIKRLADDPDSSLDDIARVVMTEPVLSARLVRVASSVALNPHGAAIKGAADAVRRVGLSTVRSLAIAVAAEQLANDQRSCNMRIVASGLWNHSVDVACWAHALARLSRAVAPDSALFGGMMIDIGQFYLVARASQFPAMERHIDRFAAFVDEWSGPLRVAILESLGLPIDDASVAGPGDAYGGAWPPSTLTDMLCTALAITETPNAFDNLLGIERKPLEAILPAHISKEEVARALAEVRADHDEMRNAMRG
jgi:hypothetical protein